MAKLEAMNGGLEMKDTHHLQSPKENDIAVEQSLGQRATFRTWSQIDTTPSAIFSICKHFDTTLCP